MIKHKPIVLLMLLTVVLYTCLSCSSAEHATQTNTAADTNAVTAETIPAVIETKTVETAAAAAAEVTEIVSGTSDAAAETMPAAAQTETAAPVPATDAIAEMISRNLDILIADAPSYASSEQELIDLHPEAFAAITACGTDALPYLQTVIEDDTIADDTTQVRICMAKAAAYAIDPSLYDLEYPSPDGTKRIRITVETFFTEWNSEIGTTYKDVFLTDAASDETLAVHQNGSILFPSVFWTEDSRYAVITHGHQKYGGGDPVIFDAENRTCTVLLLTDLTDRLGTMLGKPIQVYSVFVKAEPSETADPIRIRFDIRIGAASNAGLITGWCGFDPVSGTITELVTEEIIEPQPLS